VIVPRVGATHMHVVVARHKVTGQTYHSAPMSVLGIDHAQDERKCIKMAVDQLRRDRIVNIDVLDDYQFDMVAC